MSSSPPTWRTKRACDRTLSGATVLVLGGTGPVGRVAGVLYAREGARVRLASSRGKAKAQGVVDETAKRFACTLEAVGSDTPQTLAAAIRDADVVMATAAAGVRVLSASDRREAKK